MFPTVDVDDNFSLFTSPNTSSSSSSDVAERSDNLQPTKPRNNKELTVNMLIKEFVFCIALALTTYGALHNASSKISKHPQAVRFFKSDLYVTDWYRGQLTNALSYINKADVSFVMYYAPWDAESQYVRGEFEKAAAVLHDRVHFSAINCWNPGSECRLQHNKIPSWPILMAYTVTSRGVLYKGPRDAHSMVNFLEVIQKPLRKISSTDDLIHLLSICDVLAVGYTPLSTTSNYYNVWYNAGLRIRELDVIGEICFGVVTSQELAQEFGVDTLPSARLMLWNDTKDFIITEDGNQEWNESSILSWVLENFRQPVDRIIPLWKKSFSFDKYMDGNPVLIMFTPLNPVYEQLPMYALLREISMEYNNCNNNSSQWVTELIKVQRVQRLLYQKKNFTKFCEGFKAKKPPTRLKIHSHIQKSIVSQNNKYPWSNTTQKSQKNSVLNFLLKQGLGVSKIIESLNTNSDLLFSLGFLEECNTKVLPAEKSYYDNYGQCINIEENLEQLEHTLDSNYDEGPETSMLPLEDDQLSPEYLVQDNINHFCKLTKFAREFYPPVFSAITNGNVTSVEGLSCQNNFSLHTIAIDSVVNYHFAEALGIDVINMKDKTAVVILDIKSENQYLLSEEISAKSLREFISNYTSKGLKRFLRTDVVDAAHTHYFGSDSSAEKKEMKDIVHIQLLTTRTFRKFVRKSGTMRILAVCGGACWSHVTRALSDAARLLRACNVSCEIARVDALRDDLPWTFTAHHYPAVIVFNADSAHASDSRAYPSQTRITSSGIVALALRSLGAPQHVRVRLALCASSKTNDEKKTCLRDIREHITTVIGRNLRYWRQSQDRKLKDALLKRLQHLHDVSLKLSLLHITHLSGNNELKRTLIKSLSELSDVWDVDISMFKNSKR